MRVGMIASLSLALAACSTQPRPTDVAQAESAGKGSPAKTSVQVPQSNNPFTAFETLQVRPLALSPSGKLLFATNTPDNRLEIFHVGGDGQLESRGAVVVGLEPIAVAARSESEVWVVNHLSDSVSIVSVDADGNKAHVVRTLLVGDEPRDIVFGGAAKARAFITSAHRGQNDPVANADVVEDPSRASSLGGRADVWVFDANNLGASLGGDRLAKLTLFADTPRALAVSADGKTVYAAPFFSGNMTTVVSTDSVRHVYASLLDPSKALIKWPGVPVYQPLTGLVVKGRPDAQGNVHWTDAYGTNFDAYVNVTLLDLDVFAIDATADAATMQKTVVPYAGVGTTLFNMAVNPVSGKLYVSNTDAHNDVRFEGPIGAVTGKIVDSRVSVVDPATHALVHNNLNSHLLGSHPDAKLSRAFPQDLVVTRDGKKLYVVAQGSAKLAVYDTAALEAGTAAPTAANQVLLSHGGPTGVALDEQHGHAFVLTRFDNGISTVDLSSLKETAHLPMFNPEPANITAGRQFLYDATLTSTNGDQACASCHVGGDFDGLAWVLGNPAASPLPITRAAADAVLFTIPPALLYPLAGQQVIDFLFSGYQPLKGPMTTQSLRGLDNHGPMHWRGDRNGAIQQSGQPFTDGSGNPVVSAQPGAGIFDEEHAFESFNVAFPGLVGRTSELTDQQMADFTHFILDVTYPPNPIRNLDDSLTPDQAAGHAKYFAKNPDGSELPDDRFHNCNGCHVLAPTANAGSTKHPGFFGTDGKISFENETQVFKVAHLRNLYQKVGRYSSSPDQLAPGTLFPGLPLPTGQAGLLNPAFTSVRGFGFLHDGSIGDLQHFFMGQVFIEVPQNATTLLGQPTSPNPGGIPFFLFDGDGNQVYTVINGQPVPVLDPTGYDVRRQIVSFLMAYDSNLKPIVGQQGTLTASNQSRSDVLARLALLESQAAAGHCDLVVKGVVDGKATGFTFVASANRFTADRAQLGTPDDATLRALVSGGRSDALTFTAVPPGSGWRIGVDRDGDGTSDGN